MTSVTDPFDEFSFLPEQAASIGAAPPSEPPARLSFTLPDGRALSALRWGSARPRVTLLHGVGLNAHTWDRTLIAAGVPALAIDLAGHGDSTWRDDAAYTPAHLAGDVVHALDAWTDQPQVLVGHSLGALAGAAVAARRPDLVEQLVVIDITPGVNPSAGPARLREFFRGPTDWADREELVDRALEFGLGGTRDAARVGVYLNTRVRPDGRVEWKHHFARLAALAPEAPASAPGTPASTDTVSAALGAAGWADLQATVAPILFLRAAHGFVTDADADDFRRRVPGSATEVVDSGHNVQEEQPVLLGERIAALVP